MKSSDGGPRCQALARLDSYYSGTQYAHLAPSWEKTVAQPAQPIPFRMRQPSVVIPLPALIVDSFTRALWGAGRRAVPTLEGSAGTEANAALAAIMREGCIVRTMREATRRTLSIGSGCIAWCLREGKLHTEAWDAKWCQPTFSPGSNVVESIEYKFPFLVEVEREGAVQAETHWARQTVDAKSWTTFKPAPEVDGREPVWVKEAALSVEHGLGFCPVVWMTVGEKSAYGFDGTSVYASLLPLFDELNYSSSQAGRALYQNLDPQTVITGVNESDVAGLLKGSGNAWTLPKEGKASLLESSGSYVDQAKVRADALRKWVLDATAVIVNDAEKIGGAQSGVSLELLNAPFLAAIDDLRDDVGAALVALLGQILAARGQNEAKHSITLAWGRHYAPTPSDALQAAQAVSQAVAAGALSRASAARFLAPYFGVQDVELDQVAARADQDRDDDRTAVMTGGASDTQMGRAAGILPRDARKTEE